MTHKQSFILAAAAILFSACSTSGSQVQIATTPEGAEARLEDGRFCTTPCTLLMRDETRITISYIGYKPKVVDITPSPFNIFTTLNYELEYVSGSASVEAAALPSVEATSLAPPELTSEPQLIGVGEPPEDEEETDEADEEKDPALIMEPIGLRDDYEPD